MKQVDLFGEEVMPEQHGSKLGSDWDYPPFSVWNAREGWWQDRKRAWLSLGIKSELGRGGGVQRHESAIEGHEAIGNDGQPGRSASGGGLTWGSSPEITSKGLNFYRDKAKGGKLMAAAFDTRHGLATWQKDKRNGK